jgi:integrase
MPEVALSATRRIPERRFLTAAHRFRKTFAPELLLAGVPIGRVSGLLGDQSVRITEKYYAPWVRSRQEQLEGDLMSAWSRDPLLLHEAKGIPEVHEKPENVN